MKKSLTFLAAALLLAPVAASAALLSPSYPEVSGSTGVGFDDPTEGATRRASFERALDIWSDILAGSTTNPIVVRAIFNTTSGSVLAFASPEAYASGFSGSVASRRYAISLANQISGSDLNAGTHEINITFGDAINWYYPEFGAIPGTRIDFITVALHEIGHGLNFSSNYSTASGAYGGGIPGIYDSNLYLDNGGGSYTAFTTMSNGQRVAASISGAVDWGGQNVVDHYGDYMPIYAPNPVEGGSSISHFNPGVTDELMGPSVANGVRKHDIGMCLEAFLDMGWEVEPSATPAVAFPRGPSATRQRTVTEGDAAFQLPVSLTTFGTSTVTVNVTTAGVPVAGTDYTVSPTTLTFNPGVKTQYLTIQALNDGDVEGQEIATISLASPTGGTLDLGYTSFQLRIDNNAAGMQDWNLY